MGSRSAPFRNHLVRALAGAVLGAGLAPLGRVLAPQGSLGFFDWGAVAVTLAALAAGWPGMLGASAGLIAFLVVDDLALVRAVQFATLSSLPALLIQLGFRRACGTSRAIPDLGSYLVVVGGALAGSLLGGLGLGWLVFRPSFLTGAAIWGAGMFTGILLVCPPLAMVLAPLADRWLPTARWPPAPDGSRRAGARVDAGPSRWPAAPGGTAAWAAAGLAVVAAGTATAAVLSSRIPGVGGWLNALLLVPIVWAARSWGTRGGLVAASATGIFFLAWRSWEQLSFEMHRATVEVFPLLLLFCFVGSLLGASIDREKGLQADLARHNLLLREDLERAVLALGGALEAKDHATQDHVHRVSGFATAVGARMGIHGREMELLRWASRLHDIGKIGISEQVLLKPGPLAPEESELMQRHPEIGARILREIAGLEDAAEVVLHHQERFDGRRDGAYPGYPAGLAGESIPLGSRIIAVVDAFDAMTSDRPYRGRVSMPEAIAELRAERGLQFDPEVVDHFLAELETRRWE